MVDPSPLGPPPRRQPFFNIPSVIVGLLVVILGIQALESFVLDTYTGDLIIWDFGFVPAGLTAPQTLPPEVLTGAARLWTFVTYSLLHGGWEHVGFNALWLAAFGSPLAWRFGTARFLLFSAVAAIAGALVHLAIFPFDARPLVGASAAISAHMAGAARFVFAAGGPMWRPAGTAAYRLPAAPLADRHPRPPRAGLPRRLVRPQPALRHRHHQPGASPPARSPGTPISAASSPACCSSPCSIPCARDR